MRSAWHVGLVALLIWLCSALPLGVRAARLESGQATSGAPMGSGVRPDAADPAPGVAQPVRFTPGHVPSLPLFFVPNQGQFGPRVAYAVQGRDQTIYFAPEGLTLVFREAGRPMPAAGMDLPWGRQPRPCVLRLGFLDANPDVTPVAQDPTEALVSYFRGQPADWHSGLPTYRRLLYPDLWPGIDLAFSGGVDRLKYEFIVHPGADPACIAMAYHGAQSLAVSAAGQLVVSTAWGDVLDDAPIAYQDVDGQRVSVPSAYLCRGAVVSYSLGDYDPARILVIDPAVLVYGGFLGGAAEDGGTAIAVGPDGSAYIAGLTLSAAAAFPEGVGPDLSYNGGQDAFVAKLNAAGTALVYCGYIGGVSVEDAYGIAVDRSGCAYVVGKSSSFPAQGFPATVGPDLTYNSLGDAFVAKVNAAGTALVYCGYIGGAGVDEGRAIAVDAAGNAYVVGSTVSLPSTFPVLGGPRLVHGGGTLDAFVAKVNPSGAALVYCGYIGGNSVDQSYGVAVDSTGCAFVVGTTASTEATFPVRVGPDLTHNGGSDAFVAKVNPAGSALLACGYIGGSGSDQGVGVALDRWGSAYVSGTSGSVPASFPVRVGPRLTYGGAGDAFVAKLDPALTSLVYCGYIGGNGSDRASGLAVDGTGSAIVVGVTASGEATFPVKLGFDMTYGGGNDGFVARVNSAGRELSYCSYLGGSGADAALAVAVDATGNAYVTGQTASNEATFPVRVGPDLTQNGDDDAFVAKLAALPAFSPMARVTPAFGSSTGWTSQDTYPRAMADVNGDGRADVVGFGANGVYIGLSNGPAGSAGGAVGTLTLWAAAFGANAAAGGWASQNAYPRLVGDVNGDGKADIVGLGSDGAFVSLSTGNAFGPMRRWIQSFGAGAAGGGWTSQDTYPRALGDVNGDGKADLVGCGNDGVYVSLSTGIAFGPMRRWVQAFGAGVAGGGWASQNVYPRFLADVNGDGRADVVGCGADGVYVSLSMGALFAAPARWVAAYGAGSTAGGWTSQNDYPRLVVDLNGDGRCDMVGLGGNGALYSLSTGNGFDAMTTGLAAFGKSPAAGGWTSQELFPRASADVTGDGLADLVGFGGAGVYVAARN